MEASKPSDILAVLARIARWFIFKQKIWANLGRLRWENVDIFYDRLEYFMYIRDVLGPFETFCVHLVNFSPFWYHVPRQIWQPWCWDFDASYSEVF
jgi:hypothetical protein